MARPWFEPTTGAVLLDDYVQEMDSYRLIVADATVTDAEIKQQTQRVMGLLKQLEAMLPADAREVATDALCELAVLNVIQSKRRADRP